MDTPQPKVDPFEWQRSRQRPDFRAECPISGFGPRGEFTMYVPNPRPMERMIFRDGRPVVEKTAGVMNVPEIQRARDNAIASLERAGAGEVAIMAESFYLYAVAILRTNYTLSDDDLTTLLGTPGKWMAQIVQHICGGQDYLDALAAIAPVATTRILPSEPLNPPPVNQPDRSPKHRRTKRRRK